MGTQHALGMHTGSHTVFGPRHTLQSARRHAWKLAPRCSRLVAASRPAIGFACTARAREVVDKCNFLFSSPALVRRHPCRRVLPSRQAGPAALGQDVRLVRKTGHLKIKCRQAGGGGAGGGKKCYECVKVGHIASRSMAVTGHKHHHHRRAPKAEDRDKAKEDYWKDDDAAAEAKESGLE